MVASLYLALALALGLSLYRLLRLPLSRYEAAATVVTLGLLGFSWLMLLPALILPYAWSVPLGCLLTFAVTVVCWHLAGPATAPAATPPRTMGWWTIIAVATAIFWTILMFGHDLLPYLGSLVSAGSTWGDFGYHASLISHQAAATKLPLDLPVASGVSLAYYFLIDFLSAIFIRGGWSLNLALAVPGALLGWSLSQLIIGFGWRLVGRFGAGVLALILGLTNGSAIGVVAAWTDWQASHQSLGIWLGHLSQNYSAVDASNAHFNNAVADLLLPQRPFLFGLAAWLILAILWHSYLDHANRRWLLASAILLGLLPLAHTYSFLVGGALFASLGLWHMRRYPNQRRDWLLAAGLIAILALPQILWLQLTGGSGTAGYLISGWDRAAGEPLLAYEWRNFGLWLVVLLGCVAVVFMTKLKRFRPWIIPFLIIFLVAQVYSFQAFAFDNLKLFFYVYLVTMVLLAGAIWHSGRWKYLLAAAAIAALSVPGILTITREFQLRDVFASATDIELATWAQANTDPTAIFASTDSPTQPVATLAGRQLVFGYRGWLYSRHLDYSVRQQAVSDLLAGNASTPAVAAYHPNYLVVASGEPYEWTVNRAALAGWAHPFHNATWDVYQIPANN